MTRANLQAALLNKAAKDVDAISARLATFIDYAVIKSKFDSGFPDHVLDAKTVRRKGHNRVGVKSGRLVSAATSNYFWTIFPASFGGVRRILIKKKAGLTPYAHLVATKASGELDFLTYTAQDTVRISAFLTREFTKLQYFGDFDLRVIRS